jgi:uncharacterized protein
MLLLDWSEDVPAISQQSERTGGSMATDLPAIDADGHLCERESDVRRYLEAPFDQRTSALRPTDYPWDMFLRGRFPWENQHRVMAPEEEVATWLRLMDEHGLESAVLFATGANHYGKLRELDFAAALCRAANTLFAREYDAVSPRVQAVGVLPLQDPAAAVAELRRAATELGIGAFEVASLGLRVGLGDPFYDALWAEADRLGVAICVHGDRQGAAEVGGDRFRTFGEMHCYSFPMGVWLHFTSILWNAIPLRYPNVRLAFMETGATWLPYYLDRLDEHWELRGAEEAPLLTRRPSAVFRESPIYASLEAEEGLLGATVDYLGAEHFVYASDVPHWDSGFPANLDALRAHPDLTRDAKERLLYRNAQVLFGLGSPAATAR